MTDIGDMIERGSDGPEWEQCRSYETESLRQECWRWIERATKAETENAALRAEVERLREERDRQYDQNTEQIVRIASLEDEINKLRRMLHLADSMYEQAATQANDYATENAALRAEVERLGNQASLFKIYMEALDRSIFDMSLCRVCGQPVVCLPDGLVVCEPCAKRERVEQ